MRYDHLPRLCKSALVSTILVLEVLTISSAPASAQEFISPYLGFNFGGDSGCPTATNCEDRHNNFGVSGGKLGAIGGGEFEFGYAKNFFGDAPGVDTSVLTLFGNVIIGPKFGFIRPFVLGGVGLIKSHVELTAGSLLDSSNNFGWDLGGGLMFMFGDHVGVRGDLRRFQSFQNQTILGFSLADEKLKFNRATAGLVLAF
jgi:opacity protein-like surface antigen